MSEYTPKNRPSIRGINVSNVWHELNEIRNTLDTLQVKYLTFDTHDTEPDKPRQGRVYYADGTNWDPGKGEGPYIYDGSAWVLLSLAAGSVGPTELDVSQHGGEYIKLSEVQTSGTNGGTFTTGAWQTRTLNTEDADTGGNASISSNQFTLDAGTYILRGSAPAYSVNRHKLKIRNITDSTDDLIGISHHCNSTNSVHDLATINGTITIASSKTFELQHRCATTQATNGFGVASSFGVSEVYAVVELWKVK